MSRTCHCILDKCTLSFRNVTACIEILIKIQFSLFLSARQRTALSDEGSSSEKLTAGLVQQYCEYKNVNKIHMIYIS